MHDTQEGTGRSGRWWLGLVYLGLAAFLEVGFLYLLIVVDTPVAPAVRRALRNPAGLFAVVMGALTLVCFTMAILLGLAERVWARGGGPAGGGDPPAANG
jgi:hypothetical protein